MRKRVRRIFWIGFTTGLLLLILLYVLVSHTNFPAEGLTRIINHALPQRFGLEVSVGEVRGDLFNGLDLADITLYTFKNRERRRVVRIKEARLRYRLRDLVRGRPVFSEVSLTEPLFDLDESIRDRLLGGSRAEDSRSKGLPLFGVEDLQIRNGRFSYRSASEEQVTLQDVHLEGRVRAGSQGVSAALESGRFYWAERDLHVRRIEFEGGLRGDTLTLDRADIATAKSIVHGSGKITDLNSPKLKLVLEESGVSLEEVGRLAGLSENGLRGTVSLGASLTGPPTRLRIQTEAEGTVNDYTFDHLRAEVTVAGRELDFSEFDLRSAQARISGSGKLSLKEPGSYTAEVALEHLDLSVIRGVNVRADLNGSISVAGQGLSPRTVGVSAELRLGKSLFDGYPFDGCVGRCRLSPQSISTDGPLTLRSGGMAWTVKGEIRFDGSVDVRSGVEVKNLEALTEAFHLPLVRGKARATATVSGTISDPNIDGQIWVDSLANSTYGFTTCTGKVRLKNVVKNPSGSAEISGNNGRIGKVPIAQLAAHLSFHGSSVQIDSLWAENSEAAVEAKGNLHMADGAKALSLTRLRARFRQYSIANGDTVHLSFGGDGAIVGRGSFTAGEGGFDLSGSVDPGGEIDVELTLESVDLSPIVETMRITRGIRGIAEGKFTIGGSLEAPRSALAVTLRKGEVATFPFDTLRCVAEYDAERMEILELELFHQANKVLQCRGSIPLRLSLSGVRPVSLLREDEICFSLNLADFDLLPVSRLTRGHKPFQGLCSAEMELRGTVKDPALTVSILIQGTQYDVLQFGGIRGKLQYDAGRLRILFVEASHEGTEYACTGVIPLNLTWPFTDSLFSEESMDVSFGMAGEVPADLISLFTDKVEHLSGTMDLRFSLNGALINPVLNGDLSLEGGRLQLSDLENPVTDLEVEVTVADTLLTIDSFVGRMSRGGIERGGFFDSLIRLFTFRKRGDGGQLSLQGTIDFTNLDQIVYDLTCEGEDLFLRPLRQEIDLIAEADLRLSGTGYPHLSGDVTLTQGLVREALKPREQVEPEPAPSGAQGMGPSVDLNVHIPSNLWVEGSDYLQELSVELRGDLRILKPRTGPEFRFFGTLETMRGKYHIYGNLFRITQGNISFGGISEINPGLNIEAETRVGREPIYLNLRGTLLQPEVKLWSQSGYLEKDIIALLTLGTTTEAVDTVGVPGAFESKATNVLGSLIEGELARRARQQLGVDTFEITSNAGLQLVPYETQVTVGKYLSPRVYLEYSRRLAAESEQEVDLEYRLNRHLSFLGTRDRRGLYHLQLQFKFDY